MVRRLTRLGLQPLALTDPELQRVEELADLAAVRHRLEHALSTLPADQQQAVRLRVCDEQAYAEIARALDVPEDVIRARVSRALKTLHGILEPTEDEH